MTLNQIDGLALKSGPLGEKDRLLTFLTNTQGIIKVSAPGARKPKSQLSAAIPLVMMSLQLSGKSSLKSIRSLKIIHSYTSLGQNIESLSAAQALLELTLLIVGDNDPQPSVFETVILHLNRLEHFQKNNFEKIYSIASSVQAIVHLLALGGYCLPLQNCSRTGSKLSPPLGEWEWNCSFFPEEGFAIGHFNNARFNLNPSELALLQRLLQPSLPVDKSLKVIGPSKVWLKLIELIESWIETNLAKKINSIQLIKSLI